MNLKELINRIKTRLWVTVVEKTRHKGLYPFIYASYWHYLFSKDKSGENTTCYYGAIPNPGAGIGHQLANWIAGYWYARQFGLRFAHIPFSTPKWEEFLGFGREEARVEELLQKGYKARRLPLFRWNNKAEMELNRAIIRSYADQNVVFIAEQDQYYKEQIGVIDDLKRKFNNSDSRKKDQIIYNAEHFNIAVHVRRTVVIGSKIIEETDEAKALRWLTNDYYEKVLKRVLENIEVEKPVSIFIFSTGRPEEFAEFGKYGNVYFGSDMNEYDTFLHLIKADLLITSKSSFSYKPALMSNGVKVCPRNFWHGYPEDKDWVLVENDGTFDTLKLKEALK